MARGLAVDKQTRLEKLREELANLELEITLEQNDWHRTTDSNNLDYWIHPLFEGVRFYDLKTLRNFVRVYNVYNKLFPAIDELLDALPNAEYYANRYDALKMFANDQAVIEIPVGKLKQLAKVIYGED